MVTRTVSHRSTTLSPTFDVALETMSFGRTCYVYDVACFEEICLNFVTDFIISLHIADFTNEALRSSFCFICMTFSRFVDVHCALIVEAQLDCVVAVVFDRLDLQYHVCTNFNNRYRN